MVRRRRRVWGAEDSLEAGEASVEVGFVATCPFIGSGIVVAGPWCRAHKLMEGDRCGLSTCRARIG